MQKKEKHRYVWIIRSVEECGCASRYRLSVLSKMKTITCANEND